MTEEVTDEEVIAFVDGKLEGAALRLFEVRMQIDPELAQRVESHRWMARQIVAAYGPPPGDDIDETLIDRLGLADDNVVSLAEHRERRKSRLGWATRVASVAASLMVGILVGQLALAPHGTLETDGEGRILASGTLAQALSDQLAGQQGAVRIGISFNTKDGVCRTFSTDQGMSGLGCQSDKGWVVPLVATNGEARHGTGEYRLAGDAVAPSVMAEVDRRIVGAPLSPADEKKLKAAGWR